MIYFIIMLRHRKLKQGVAVFFLINFVSHLLSPSVTYALTNGPAQPEFTSYQSPGATDMVNPLTGDFSYSIDLLEVPGPEGGLTLPLNYTAGIRPEQQASWVGLGWSLNPGAISRNMLQFPDDASGQTHITHYKDELNRGWKSSIPGIYSMGWDSEVGHYGEISILRHTSVANLSWNKDGFTYETLGISISGSGVKFDGVEAIMDLAKIAITAASGGYATAAQAAISVGTDLAMGIVSDAMAARNISQSVSGFGTPTTVVDDKFFHDDYWNFFNEKRTEQMFGSLYYQDMPVEKNDQNTAKSPTLVAGAQTYKAKAFQSTFYGDDNGKTYLDVAADMHLDVKPEDDYTAILSPTSIAHDYFSVMGPGVSGSIKPYRLDVGALAFPKQMSEKHYKFNLVPYTAVKPQFRYEGSAGNGYSYHAGTGITADNLGVDADWSNVKLQLNERSWHASDARTEPDRYGLKSGRLAEGKHIEWFSNKELGAAFPNPVDKGLILEFKAPEATTTYSRHIIGYEKNLNCDPDQPCGPIPIYSEPVEIVTRNAFRASLPDKGIGGFAVTAEDGTTYHYTLPVYQYIQFSKVILEDSSKDYFSETFGDKNDPKKSGYAIAWLLTAITGPDFVDRGPGGKPNGILDESDWGRWVKFDYGKFSSNYKWRTPYSGYNLDEEDNKVKSYSEGFRETYYLNSISTRTHTALFIKDVRKDGRGHYSKSTAKNTDLNIYEEFPSSSLKLEEIVLLANPDYKKLINDNGIAEGVPGLKVNGYNNSTFDRSLLRNGDTFREVIDIYDIQGYSAYREFINEKALKRIVFNHTYELSPNTTNSFESAGNTPGFQNLIAGRSGKLTLRSLSIYGPHSTKLLPDFIFEYGNNPVYDPNKWDGFGMYNRTGNLDPQSHKPATFNATGNLVANQDAAAWSLTRVITPLGGTMDITYERDTYAYVSEFGSQRIRFKGAAQNELTAEFNGDLRNHLKVGDRIDAELIFTDNYMCDIYEPCPGGYEDCVMTRNVTEEEVINRELTITHITASTITVDQLPEHTSPVYGEDCEHWDTNLVANIFVPREMNGGDIRVRQITVSDDRNNKYATRYLYSTPTEKGSTSTGVISQEPKFVGGYKHSFYGYFDYPSTSVLYGKVTVLKGRLEHDNDYVEKTEFYFTTPSSKLIQYTGTINRADYQLYAPLAHTKVILPGFTKKEDKKVSYLGKLNKLNIKTSQIGQIKAVKRYNNKGMLNQSVVYNYSSELPNERGIDGQGIYTEGTLLAEAVLNKYTNNYNFKLNRTIKRYQPSVLTSVVTSASGITDEKKDILWDFITGDVLRRQYRNSLGQVYESQEVPAYHLAAYASMGSKAENPANKNMLVQRAGAYVYKVTDTPANNRRLIAAGVQTWKKDWDTYRTYNESESSFIEAAGRQPVWRKYQAYAWKSTEVNGDGSLKHFVPFDYAATTQHEDWLRASEQTHYSSYSHALQAKDINGNFTSKKYGYRQTQVIASAINAKYTEMAFSGAEDGELMGGTTLFGGEVLAGQGIVTSELAHTGAHSLQLSMGRQGFIYKAVVGAATNPKSEIEAGRKYRADVWVHRSDLRGDGKLTAFLNDGIILAESRTHSEGMLASGEWRLISIAFQVPASAVGKKLTVACKSEGAIVYFDDFRFQPVDAVMTANVYNPHTGQVTYTLDNNNLYVKNEYDNSGRLVRTFKEKLTNESNATLAKVLISESNYFFARMNLPLWLPTGETKCEQNANGYTGNVLKQLKDVNTSSPSYGQVKWLFGGYSNECPSCDGPFERWVNGVCETGRKVFVSSTYKNGKYECSYQYVFSDSSQSMIFTETSEYPCTRSYLSE